MYRFISISVESKPYNVLMFAKNGFLISCKTTVAHLVSKYHIPKPMQNWYRRHQKHDLYCKLKELVHRKLG